MKRTESGVERANRQCWECLKRRLVCDHTLPHCKKCVKAGKECSGYDAQKPLQWVEPGKVTSRRRKKDLTPKVYTIGPKDDEAAVQLHERCHAGATAVPSTVDFLDTVAREDPTTLGWLHLEELGPTPGAIEIYKSELASLLVHEENAEYVVQMAEQASAGATVAEHVLLTGNQDKLRALIQRGQESEIALLLNTTRNPLDRLKRLLSVMGNNYIPSYDYLSNETSEVVQAVDYFNTRIYPDCKETENLAPNPAVIHFPLWALHVLPPAMHHTLVCMGLNHYIHALPLDANRAVVASNRSKIYKYRGQAIRALSENVANEKTRSSDLTISSILMFMAMEVQNSSVGDWRSHAYGLKRLIDMRGGFEDLLRNAPYLTSSLVLFIIIVTFSNSLGPGTGQINITEPLEQHLKEVNKLYSLIFPYILCPPTLFTEIIRVNRLRQEIVASPFEDASQHALDAHDILARIEAFVPEDWAQPGDNNNDFQLLGSTYQCAVALYCTMSLQALDALPNTLEMDAMRAAYGARLEENLRTTMQSKTLSKFSLYPLCVLGVEAGYRDQQSTRVWIERRLEEHSRTLGSSCPLKARAVLRRYWASGKVGWDECFDGPLTVLVSGGVI